jgi:CO/xanthine dehydrogenase Mo-binding subunit
MSGCLPNLMPSTTASAPLLAGQRDPHLPTDVGEIGIVGTAAAIANAVYHATGIRVRDLPITLDKLLP